VTTLAFHPAGNLLLSGSRDRTIRLWDLANGKPIKVLEGHEAWVQGLVLVNRHTMIASVAADRTVRLWDLRPAAK
jgi:WD40 repeat protein